MPRPTASTKNMPRFPEFDGLVVEVTRYDAEGQPLEQSEHFTLPHDHVPLTAVLALSAGHVQSVEVFYANVTSKEFRIVGRA